MTPPGILRPQVENDLTIGDRTPSLFFADLVNLHSTIFPQLVEKKKQEADRVMPIRKRTALVDQRPSRRNISEDDTHQALFERQQHINKEEMARTGSQTRREQAQEQQQPYVAQQPRDKGKGREVESDSFDVPPVPALPQPSQPATASAPAPAP